MRDLSPVTRAWYLTDAKPPVSLRSTRGYVLSLLRSLRIIWRSEDKIPLDEWLRVARKSVNSKLGKLKLELRTYRSPRAASTAVSSSTTNRFDEGWSNDSIQRRASSRMRS